jgi:WD40 repeat protein
MADCDCWNIKEGRVVGDPLEGHKDAVVCLDWSPNGLEIASGSQDGTVRRWNPDTGWQIGSTIETGSWVNAIKYSPQVDKFASGGHDSMIHMWSMGGELLFEIKAHGDWVVVLVQGRRTHLLRIIRRHDPKMAVD